jgi:hypothetical protein
MTKTKELVWRLNERPTVEEIIALKEAGLLSPVEAKEIVFKEKEEPKKATPSELEGIRKEVELLRELVLKLSEHQKSTAYPIIWYYTGNIGTTWTKPYQTWMSSNQSVDSGNTFYSYTSGTLLK